MTQGDHPTQVQEPPALVPGQDVGGEGVGGDGRLLAEDHPVGGVAHVHPRPTTCLTLEVS